MKVKMAGSNSRALVLLVIASLFLLLGLLFDFMPAIVDNQIKRNVDLATNNEIQSIWSRPPVDFHSYYWLYEVLNPDDFAAAGKKPQIRKVGPYHFTSRVRKRIIEISQNKLRVTYNTTRLFSLNQSDPINLQADLDRPLTLLNPVYASLVAGTRHASQQVVDPQARTMISASTNRLSELFNETLFINITARTALIGRRLLLLDKVRRMIDTFGLDIKLPSGLFSEDSKFGFVALLNNSWSGPFEIYSGHQASQESLGELISYQGRRRLTEFRGRCNRLQSSLGELRPMPLAPEQTLEIFQPNFCRILHLRPTGTRKLREGLAISYRLAPEDLMSAQKNPDNRCFCQNETGAGEDYCSLDGAIELAPCVFHSPLVLTVGGVPPDQRITSSVANWDEELAQPSLELLAEPEPDPNAQMMLLKRLGLPVKVDLTINLFMKVVRDTSFKLTQNVPEVSYLPVVMIREVFEIPPPLGQIIYNLENFLILSSHIKVIMYMSGLLLLLWLTGHQYRALSHDRVQPSDRASVHSSHGVLVVPEADGPSSADSNRSQPPSARSSFELGLPDSNNPQIGVSDQGATGTGTRVFSKVDELARRPETGNHSALGADPTSQQPAIAGQARKNWLVQVCSNLVRLLTGLRSSINDASQLNVSENNYQDKQLEMLAGKIDNWYNSSTSNGSGLQGSSMVVAELSPTSLPAKLRSRPRTSQVHSSGPDEAGQVEPAANGGTKGNHSDHSESAESQTTVINRAESDLGAGTGQPEEKAVALERLESAMADIGSNIEASDQSGPLDESLASLGPRSGLDEAESALGNELAKPDAKRLLTRSTGDKLNTERNRGPAKLDPPNGISAKLELGPSESVANESDDYYDDDHPQQRLDTSTGQRELGSIVAGNSAAPSSSVAGKLQDATSLLGLSWQSSPSANRKLQIKAGGDGGGGGGGKASQLLELAADQLNGANAGTGNNNISNGKIIATSGPGEALDVSRL